MPIARPALLAGCAAALALALACGEDAPPSAPLETHDQHADEGGAVTPSDPTVPPAPESLPKALLVALSKFETGPDGKPVPKSEWMVLARRGGAWVPSVYTDPESNVFHEVLAYTPDGGAPGVLTLGGSAAAVKLWRKGEAGLAPVETLWQADFGGKFSRMREAEVGDVYGDGKPSIVVATHDQGVVAVLRPKPGGGYDVAELDRQADIFVHEIELGDLDGDGTQEIYATPSEPNRLDGVAQHGEVVRYVPAKGEGRTVVADLGTRHAKEILVADVDGDGRQELYVSIEAAEGGSLEVKRFEAGTPPTGGFPVVTLSDPMCRFLTVGDVDGDGRREMVLAAKDTGVWLARPGTNPRALWSTMLVDGHSKGFEHAALLTDLDGDGRDELYVASDDDKEIRRYVWDGQKLAREVIHRRSDPLPILTWNLDPVPVAVVE
jgi:hypothetical protein